MFTTSHDINCARYQFAALLSSYSAKMQVFLVKHEQMDSLKYIFTEFTFVAAPFQATA